MMSHTENFVSTEQKKQIAIQRVNSAIASLKEKKQSQTEIRVSDLASALRNAKDIQAQDEYYENICAIFRAVNDVVKIKKDYFIILTETLTISKPTVASLITNIIHLFSILSAIKQIGQAALQQYVPFNSFSNPSVAELDYIIAKALDPDCDELSLLAAKTIYEQVLSSITTQDQFSNKYLQKVNETIIPNALTNPENTVKIFHNLMFPEAKEALITSLIERLKLSNGSEHHELAQICLENWPEAKKSESSESSESSELKDFAWKYKDAPFWTLNTRSAVVRKLSKKEGVELNTYLNQKHSGQRSSSTALGTNTISKRLESEFVTPAIHGTPPSQAKSPQALKNIATNLLSLNEETRTQAKNDYEDLTLTDQESIAANYALAAGRIVSSSLADADANTHEQYKLIYEQMLEIEGAKKQFRDSYLNKLPGLIESTFSKNETTRNSSITIGQNLAFDQASEQYLDACKTKVEELANTAFSADKSVRDHSVAVAKSFQNLIPEVFASYKTIYDAKIAEIAAKTFNADPNIRNEAIVQSSYITFDNAKTVYQQACKEKVESIARAAAEVDVDDDNQTAPYVTQYEALPTLAMKQDFIHCYITHVGTPATAFFQACLDHWPTEIEKSHEKLASFVSGYVLVTVNSETAAWNSATLDKVFDRIKSDPEATKALTDGLAMADILYGFDRPANTENQTGYYSGQYVSLNELKEKYSNGNSVQRIAQLIEMTLATAKVVPAETSHQEQEQQQRQENTILYIYNTLLTSEEQDQFNRAHENSIKQLAQVIFDTNTSPEKRENCFIQASQLKDSHASETFKSACQQNAQMLAALAFSSNTKIREHSIEIGNQLCAHAETLEAYKTAYIEQAKELATAAFHPSQASRAQSLEIYRSFNFPEAKAAFVERYISTYNQKGSMVNATPEFAQICANDWPINLLDSQVLLEFCIKQVDLIIWDLTTIRNVFSKLDNDEDRKKLNRTINVQIEFEANNVAVFGFNQETHELQHCSYPELQSLMETASNTVTTREVIQKQAEAKIASIISWAGTDVLDSVFKNFWREETAEEQGNRELSASTNSKQAANEINKVNYGVLAAGLRSINESNVITDALEVFIKAMPGFDRDRERVAEPQVLSFSDFWQLLDALAHSSASSENKLKHALELVKHVKITVTTTAELRALISIFSGEKGLNYTHALRLMLELHHNVRIIESKIASDARKNEQQDQTRADLNTWRENIGLKVGYYDASEQGNDPNFSKYIKRLENKFPAGAHDDLQYIFKLATLVHDQKIIDFDQALISILSDSAGGTHHALPEHDETRYIYGQLRKLICQALPNNVLIRVLGDRLPHLFNYTPFVNFTAEQLSSLQAALKNNTVSIPSMSMGISGSSDRIKNHILALDPNDPGYRDVPFEKSEIDKIGQLVKKYQSTLGFSENLLPNYDVEQANAQLEELTKISAASANEQAAEIFAKIFLTKILPASMDKALGRTGVGPKVSNKAFLANLCYLVTTCQDTKVAERLYFYTHNLVTSSEQDYPESDRVSFRSQSSAGSVSSIVSAGSFSAAHGTTSIKSLPGRSGIKKNNTVQMRSTLFGSRTTPLATIEASPDSSMATPVTDKSKNVDASGITPRNLSFNK